MLAELAIKNIAIIESVTVSFQKGFTVLTGETGAGKSIIIDSIHLLVGGRGSSDFVRHGADKAEIEGLFLIEGDHPAIAKCSEFGIEIEEGMLLLKRDIYPSGKSVCRVNGKLVTITILREIGRTLVDIHGQHDNQEMLDEKSHLRLLDEFGGKEIYPALNEYQSIYREYVKIKKDLASLNENEQMMAQRLDLLKFQLNEITNAQLKIGEDEQLLTEKKKLTNFEKLFSSLNTTYEALQGEQKGLDWVGLALSNLDEAQTIDEELKEIYSIVSNSYYQLEDIVHTLRDKLDELEYDPNRLNEIENRLNIIHQMKRKYGDSIEAILEYCAKIDDEIEMITNRESHIETLNKKLVSIEKDLLVEANHLTSLRKNAAEKLTEAIHKQLKDLYMDKTVFEVKFFEQDNIEFQPDGIDKIEFYMSTNPGEPLKPLAKIASGGELSRIMLALKTIFSQHQGVTSIIFDEVDTGVSGRVAQAIGEKIYRISVNSQVLSITHLPQVAALCDHHFFIRKEIKEHRTITSIQQLSECERIEEIARMISGSHITTATEEHAKELLDLAHQYKYQHH
ncbi:DNA repair protein RecN [Pallidibacillus thermolactis]|uniref:DNA repair protein RecN n=1 Tax=Pallidibacillus thermolactis TaxID=251051 RepID=UPI0021D8EA26|nr:DNA repair protein RecN [Pallidibacillus thermolactis]MCU9600309.1 DNA repair protein RecN [Pallidibacillus thermolactis subsp. kokeshiiformis]MED1672988.1 DNA repair protein RecN [Pallidibacillus thermolactis subsp. kokeshiiformis]